MPMGSTTAQTASLQNSASLVSPTHLNPIKNASRGPGSKASPAETELNPFAQARNSTPYAEVPAYWYKVLDRITDGTNTHNPPSIPELIWSAPLPNGSWVSLTTNRMRIITQTGGSSKLQYEWLEHGDMRKLPTESIQPSPTQRHLNP
jgi:hypothetical protein